MRRIGIEFRRSYQRRIESGFMDKYLSGKNILDIGYRGGDPDSVPITENAIGVELDYPGYDGVRLPFEDESQDAIMASHVLEHVPSPGPLLMDWYRVLKKGGYMCIFVPHKYLYERRADLPSLWNADHRRFYTAARLLAEIEDSLPVNGFRVRHLADNDTDFDYNRKPSEHASGCYEIELVLEKIEQAYYSQYLEPTAEQIAIINALNDYCLGLINGLLSNPVSIRAFMPSTLAHVTPWREVYQKFVASGIVDEGTLRTALAPLLAVVDVDLDWYRFRNPDLDRHSDLAQHWRIHGYYEGRPPRDYWPCETPSQ